MHRSDLLIYVVHAVFWGCFGAGDFQARRLARRQAPAAPTIGAGETPIKSKHAGLLILAHMIAFGVMYAAIGNGVFGPNVQEPSTVRRIGGAAVILAGGVFVYWARVSFASWRFRAELEARHQLATNGAFRVVRHPIYAGLDLLALGSAIWIGTWLAWLGVLLMVIGGDLRARAEEPLLERAFGEEYRAYRGRTSRFVPGIY